MSAATTEISGANRSSEGRLGRATTSTASIGIVTGTSASEPPALSAMAHLSSSSKCAASPLKSCEAASSGELAARHLEEAKDDEARNGLQHLEAIGLIVKDSPLDECLSNLTALRRQSPPVLWRPRKRVGPQSGGGSVKQRCSASGGVGSIVKASPEGDIFWGDFRVQRFSGMVVQHSRTSSQPNLFPGRPPPKRNHIRQIVQPEPSWIRNPIFALVILALPLLPLPSASTSSIIENLTSALPTATKSTGNTNPVFFLKPWQYHDARREKHASAVLRRSGLRGHATRN
ncbi:hypothetical protein L1887_49841 [Cichorium endivia]|nr:hypothetical protein L1887_49841 [Cichorium endivia]